MFLCSLPRAVSSPVRNYYNNVRYMPPTLKADNPLTDVEFEATYEDEGRSGTTVRVSCRFRRPMKVAADQQSIDLDNTWYQLYAWGSVTTCE